MAYEATFNKVVGLLPENKLVMTVLFFSMHCGSDHLSDEALGTNHDHWAKKIDFGARLRRKTGQNRTFSLGGIMLKPTVYELDSHFANTDAQDACTTSP